MWLTGLPAAGKTTIARAVAERAAVRGTAAALLDGDALRAGPHRDLGFGREDRRASVARTAILAAAAAAETPLVLVALVAPYRADRDAARATVREAGAAFVEVHVDTPLAVCRGRDPKGLYAAAAAGRLRGLTGWDDPYEPPRAPELRLHHPVTVAEAAERVLAAAARDAEPAGIRDRAVRDSGARDGGPEEAAPPRRLPRP